MAEPVVPPMDARDVFTRTLKDLGFSDAQINELLPQVTQWQYGV